MNETTITTANSSIYFMAKGAADICGLDFEYTNRPNCFKEHHIRIKARTPEQKHIVLLLANASYACPTQGEAKKRLYEAVNAYKNERR